MNADLSGNQRRRLTIVVGSVGLLAAGSVTLGPMVEAYQTKLSELDQARASLPEEPHFVPTFPRLNEKLTVLKTELAKKRRSFPVAENVSTLLMDLETLASSQVRIRHFYPTKLAPVNLPSERAKAGISVSEQQIEMEAFGSFPALYRVLSRFESYEHPVGIRGLLLTNSGVSKPGKAEQLSLKLKLSAFMLDKPPADSTVLGDLKQELEEAQAVVGVADPFARALLDPLPAAPDVLPPIPLPGPVLPQLPDLKPQSNLSELSAWRLEGILAGPEEGAIVHKAGALSQVLRLHESFDGWKIVGIEARSIEVVKGGQHARLSLPELSP